MKYTPPKLPLPRSGSAMQVYVADDKRSASVYTGKPGYTITVEKPSKGRRWSAICRDGKGVVVFDGYLEGSEDARPREVLGAMLEEMGLR